MELSQVELEELLRLGDGPDLEVEAAFAIDDERTFIDCGRCAGSGRCVGCDGVGSLGGEPPPTVAEVVMRGGTGVEAFGRALADYLVRAAYVDASVRVLGDRLVLRMVIPPAVPALDADEQPRTLPSLREPL